MPRFIVVVDILSTRVFEVIADDKDHAVEIVRSEYNMMPSDIAGEQIQNLQVEDES